MAVLFERTDGNVTTAARSVTFFLYHVTVKIFRRKCIGRMTSDDCDSLKAADG